MKKISLVIAAFIISLGVSNAQVVDSIPKASIGTKLSLGFYGGITHNLGAYQTGPDNHGFSFYEVNTGYSTGISLALSVSNKIRIRFESGYSQMEYGVDWGDNYLAFDKTINTLHDLNLNLSIDYLLFQHKNLQLFVSPGVVNEFVKAHEYTTTLSDGNFNHKNYNVLSEDYQQYQLGGNISLFARYRLSGLLSISMSPGYTYFFQKFIPDNDVSYQRFNLNVGMYLDF